MRSGIAVYTSPGGGGAFGPRIERASFGEREVFGTGNSVVLSNGQWLGVFGEIKSYGKTAKSGGASNDLFNVPPEPENMLLEVVGSDDGGNSFTERVTVSGWHMPNTFVRLTNVCPMIAADASTGPFKDQVYIVWPDARFGQSDILLSYSADRGQTWSSPIVVNDNSRNLPPERMPNQLLPAVAVNKDGVVAVTWLDRREDPENLAWRERIRVSIDGGETFEPSVAVSDSAARFDGTERWPTTASTVGGGTPVFKGGLFRLLIFAPIHVYIPGDYAGLAADPAGIFHPYWIDNRTGWHQVWTAAVRVGTTVVRNGHTS
ncbi:MAG TPA: sialidase family protein [Vicinamibacterales bacterium]|nr:sialidase family protein [Vicinamibacterales bacterium]